MTGTGYKVLSIVVWLGGLAMSLFGSGVTSLKGLGFMALGLVLVAVSDILKAIERIRK